MEVSSDVVSYRERKKEFIFELSELGECFAVCKGWRNLMRMRI